MLKQKDNNMKENILLDNCTYISKHSKSSFELKNMEHEIVFINSKIIIEETVNVFNNIIKDAKVVNNNLIQNCIKEIF